MARLSELRFALATAAILVLSCGAAHTPHLARVSGTVRDSSGQAIANAKVFLEAGLEGPISATQTNAGGEYEFTSVLPEFVGVFAYAPGRAIDGHSALLSMDDDEKLDIVLPTAGTLSGTVVDEKDKPVSGARITRALVLGTSRVGIPLTKLTEQGVAIPPTDSRGAFALTLLPEGAEVALKIAHPQYAQAAPTLHVGRDAKIKLTRGVLVTGTVVARGRDATVPNATIQFRNPEPPKDTVVTRSQSDGTYAVRLTPGPWSYAASGASFSTSAPQRILVSAEYPNQRLTLQVAPTVPLRGLVRDAKSGNPVAGASVLLLSAGAPAAKAVTGPTGAFEIIGTEGEIIVQLESAPGYILPPQPATRLHVESSAAVEVPTFWVAPLPKYSLEVVDAAEAPVAGAIVRVLFPEQFGWYATDKDGMVNLSFASLPASGTVVGMVEDPVQPNAAIFAITRERSTDAIVQLMPMTTLTGSVVNEKKSSLGGVLVEARTTLEAIGQPVTLWRTFSARDGSVQWPAVVPRTPFACFGIAPAQTDGAPDITGESTPLLPKPDEVANVGIISMPGAKEGRSALGRKYAWYKNKVLCGELPADAERRAAVLVYAPAAQATIMADSLAQAQRFLIRPNLAFAVIVPSEMTCKDSPVPILRGDPPTSATTVVVNANGEVVLECVGLPPVTAINAVAPRS